ncbi:MAG: DUF3347 domain-containing protein [Verrucomicrobia bacterium]|nr:DUF3347 domain-containing protein [Cytophagales bacterium]
MLLLVGFRQEAKPTFEVPKNFPEPVYNFKENELTAKKTALGKALFYDPILSSDGTVSCGSCHQQFAGFTQAGHPQSHGIDDKLTRRNALPLMNLAWHTSFGWDGGINNLDLFAVSPIQNEHEMGSRLSEVLERLRQNEKYRSAFLEAFANDAITTEHFLKALSQFMLTLVSANSKYDKYMRNEGEKLTEQEIQGLKLFTQKCASCHAGVLFTDFSYHNNGLKPDTADKGRAEITLKTEDLYRFKVPSLRNIAVTAPYMHDGSLTDLAAVLSHYSEHTYDSQYLDIALKTKGKAGILLKKTEKEQIIAFLKTLTDEAFLKDNKFSEQDIEVSNENEIPDYSTADNAVRENINESLLPYFTLKQGLLDENEGMINQRTDALLARLMHIDVSLLKNTEQAFFTKQLSSIKADANHIKKVRETSHRRLHFSMVSESMFQLIKAFKCNRKTVYFYACPEANQQRGGYWLEEEVSASNPYFDKQVQVSKVLKEKLFGVR